MKGPLRVVVVGLTVVLAADPASAREPFVAVGVASNVYGDERDAELGFRAQSALTCRFSRSNDAPNPMGIWVVTATLGSCDDGWVCLTLRGEFEVVATDTSEPRVTYLNQRARLPASPDIMDVVRGVDQIVARVSGGAWTPECVRAAKKATYPARVGETPADGWE